MTLWWIGNAVLLVVLVVVIVLLTGVLSAAKSIVPSVSQIAGAAAAGSKDLDATALLLTTQDQVRQTVAGVANYGGSLDVILDDAGGGVTMPAAGVVTIALIVLIVLALVYYLLSTILQLRKINQGLDEVIASVGEIVAKSAPVNDVVDDINANLDAAVSALEGLLVKKAGMGDAVGLVDGLYPGAAAEGFRDFPESREVTPPRIAEVYTAGTLTLARLGREAPVATASPAGPVLRDTELRQRRRARACTPGSGRAAVAGDRHRRARPVRGARGHRTAAQAVQEGLMQTPAPFGYERATSVQGAVAALQRLGSEARIIAGGHSLLPMMKLRLANPEHLVDINDLTELVVHPRGGRRDPDRRADPPRRPAQVRAARASTSRCSATPRR